MRQAVHALLVLMLLTCSAGCFSSEEYPTQWPPLSSNSGKPCPDISGEYRNIDLGGTVSLSALLLKKWYGNRYYPSNTRVIISQKNGSIDIETYSGGIPSDSIELLLDKDYHCSEGQLMFGTSGSATGGGVIAYQKESFAFQMAEDGSLILHAKSSGAGVVVIIPVVGSQSKYHRFKKYTVSHLDRETPMGKEKIVHYQIEFDVLKDWKQLTIGFSDALLYMNPKNRSRILIRAFSSKRAFNTTLEESANRWINGMASKFGWVDIQTVADGKALIDGEESYWREFNLVQEGKEYTEKIFNVHLDEFLYLFRLTNYRKPENFDKSVKEFDKWIKSIRFMGNNGS